ncbi:MAG: hypothetical protein AMXMBFR58_29800 [Phycisphaerae bacterium]
MPRMDFSFQTLEELDSGKINTAINREIRKIVEDLNDRPGDKASRRLSVEVTFKPATSEDGLCETCDVSFKVTSKLPPRTTREYNMQVHPKGRVSFNPASLDDTRQRSLDQANERQ